MVEKCLSIDFGRCPGSRDFSLPGGYHDRQENESQLPQFTLPILLFLRYDREKE